MNCTFECFIDSKNRKKAGISVREYEKAIRREGKKQFGEVNSGNSKDYK